MGLYSRVVGHDKQKSILSSAFSRGRIATAYLFSGQEGIGKRLFACEFIKLLHCSSPVSVKEGVKDACDRCTNCRKTDSLNHPDMLIIEPEGGVISIEKIRHVQDYLRMAPLEVAPKAVIIDNADTMSLQASNAFLKTLEEPPPHSLIILICRSPELLPLTVRSRCFHLRFQLLTEGQTREVLKRILPEVDEEFLSEISRIAMGRPAVASEIEEWLQMVKTGTLFSQKWSNKEQILQWLELAGILLRDLLVYRLTGQKNLLLCREAAGLQHRGSKTLSVEDIIELYDELTYIRRHLNYNPNVSVIQNFVEVLMAGVR